ncbi:hypothetical protein GCM10027597_38810 [Saccharopolyspora tripterygii]
MQCGGAQPWAGHPRVPSALALMGLTTTQWWLRQDHTGNRPAHTGAHRMKPIPPDV